MSNFFTTHIPTTSMKWKTYLRIFLPLIMGSMLFALNGVVDNFMVGGIPQAQAALGAINQWTGILAGFFLGTSAAGSVAIAQFYHSKNYDMAKQIAKIRYMLCIGAAVPLALIGFFAPEILARVFISGDKSSSDYILQMDEAKKYARVICLSWVLIAFTFNLGNQLREIGFGKYAMFWGFGTLTANISLNVLLIYVVKMGVQGAAWASVAGRIVALTWGFVIILWKKVQIGFKPWSIFYVSKTAWRIFWKRWIYFTSIFTVTFFIIFRTYFYSRTYPTGKDTLGLGVTGLSVVSLTGALMNVFTVTFNSLTSMSANFVGSELGKGNIEKAKSEARKVKGFTTIMAIGLSLLLVIFASQIPKMSILSESKFKNNIITFDGPAHLTQVSHSLYVIACFYPIWIWFSASYRIGNAGGRGGWFALVDWIISGPIQLAWLALLSFAVIPYFDFALHNMWMTYLMFFVSDLLKLLFQEILFYKRDWAKSITKEHKNPNIIKSKNNLNEHNIIK